MHYGAKGYLLKDAEIAHVIEAIHRVYEGKMVVDQELFVMAIQGRNPLLEREVALLSLLDKGLSTKKNRHHLVSCRRDSSQLLIGNHEQT